MITAIGVSIFLQEFVRLFYGDIPGFPDSKRAIPFPQIDYVTGPALTIGGITIQRAAMFTVGALLVCSALLYFFINRTRLGRAMQATSQDPDTARLMGINVDRIIMVAFIVGAALAAVAGLCYGLRYTNVDFRIGFLAGLKAFTAAVLGGIGNVAGAVRRRARARGGRGDGDLHPRPVRRLGLEGRLGLRDLDPGAGVQAAGSARRTGGGPSMRKLPTLITPELQQRYGGVGRVVALVGCAITVAAPFLPWAWSGDALDNMTLAGYPSPLQVIALVLGVGHRGSAGRQHDDQAATGCAGGSAGSAVRRQDRCWLLIYIALILISIAVELGGLVNVVYGGWIALVGSGAGRSAAPASWFPSGRRPWRTRWPSRGSRSWRSPS